MQTMTIQQTAETASEWFETARRTPDNEDTFVRVKDGAPQWITELVHRAHGNLLPDDWRYAKIHDALEWIRDNDDPEDGVGEFADSAVDAYTVKRLLWLSSHLSRAEYCDEAVADFGYPQDGIVGAIGLGQYAEAEEVYGLVLRALEDAAVGSEP